MRLLTTITKQATWGVLSVIFTCVGTGCSDSSTKKSSLTDSSLLATDSLPDPGIVFLLPSPSEVLSIAINNKIVYNPKFLAPAGLEKKTVLSHQQALILGIYITDLAYNVIFKNSHAGIVNLNAIIYLSQNLGIDAVLQNDYFDRFERNISNIDSIHSIFDDFTENTFSTLEGTGDYELLSVIAIGSGIEAIYLSYKSIDIVTINNTLPNLIEQKVIFDNYYQNFNHYNSNKPEFRNLQTGLSSIYALYEQNIGVITKSTVLHKSDSSFAIKDSTVVAYTNEGIIQLGDSIVNLRNSIIQLKY